MNAVGDFEDMHVGNQHDGGRRFTSRISSRTRRDLRHCSRRWPPDRVSTPANVLNGHEAELQSFLERCSIVERSSIAVSEQAGLAHFTPRNTLSAMESAGDRAKDKRPDPGITA
jgi:hypothetical protein